MVGKKQTCASVSKWNGWCPGRQEAVWRVYLCPAELHHAMVAAAGVGLGGLFLREWSVFDVDERMGLYALG